jgi:hypothetical protein
MTAENITHRHVRMGAKACTTNKKIECIWQRFKFNDHIQVFCLFVSVHGTMDNISPA